MSESCFKSLFGVKQFNNLASTALLLVFTVIHQKFELAFKSSYLKGKESSEQFSENEVHLSTSTMLAYTSMMEVSYFLAAVIAFISWINILVDCRNRNHFIVTISCSCIAAIVGVVYFATTVAGSLTTLLEINDEKRLICDFVLSTVYVFYSCCALIICKKEYEENSFYDV